MKNCLVIDTSIGSANRGDDIINECFYKEMDFILKDKFIFKLPSHVSPFHWYQVLRNSFAIQRYYTCDLKFVAGTNLLVKNMLTHYPQWNLNLFNYRPLKGAILVGVGAGAGETSNLYTKHLYKKLLNHDFIHSVRDERSKNFVESLGLKAINTGCITMWGLTPQFCNNIPIEKSDKVVFTLTAKSEKDTADQFLIDVLNKHYESVFFWIQGEHDLKYLHNFDNIERIKIISPNITAYSNLLINNEIDYIGTRLHAGIYAMRHKKRTIILVIDERAREINKHNNLNCLEKSSIELLPSLINNPIKTDIKMPFDSIAEWRSQFKDF